MNKYFLHLSTHNIKGHDACVAVFPVGLNLFIKSFI